VSSAALLAALLLAAPQEPEELPQAPVQEAVVGASRTAQPAAAGTVYIWAVLRDSRGGLAWSSLRADVVEAPR
jgi:outer membrane cobalamin receptor